MEIQNVSPDEAKRRGYKAFNNVPHQLIDVPDGNSTLSCKMSDGSTITFCFLSGDAKGLEVPSCVDIQVDTGIPEHSALRKDGELSIGQGGILFGDKNVPTKAKDIRFLPAQGYSLMTVFLRNQYLER